MLYQFVYKYILQKFKAGDYANEEFKMPQAQLYQMYFAVNRLDAEKFVKLDFITNFGVEVANRKLLTDAMQNGGGFQWAQQNLFSEIPNIQLLKLHQYLNWADKKLHSVFFIENKDQLNEDLLADFKEGDSTAKTGLSNQSAPKNKKSNQANEQKNKPAGIQVSQPLFVSHHEFMYGKMPGQSTSKVISVESTKDFPTLGVGLGLPAT